MSSILGCQVRLSKKIFTNLFLRRVEVFVAANEVCPRQYLVSLPSFDWLMGCWDQRSQQPIDFPPSEEIFATLRWAADWWTPNLARGVSLQYISSVFIRFSTKNNFQSKYENLFYKENMQKKAKNVQKLTKLTTKQFQSGTSSIGILLS